jgi:hypothetical protein
LIDVTEARLSGARRGKAPESNFKRALPIANGAAVETRTDAPSSDVYSSGVPLAGAWASNFAATCGELACFVGPAGSANAHQRPAPVHVREAPTSCCRFWAASRIPCASCSAVIAGAWQMQL